jgi:Mn-dependent DtxR family transcriptional regulator
MLQTVDRALRLLLLFEEVNQEYRLGEMAAMLGVDKSSASDRHADQPGLPRAGSGQRGVQDRP